MVSPKCGDLRNDTNELPYETETDLQSQQANGKAVVEGIKQEVGITHRTLCVEIIKGPLQSTGCFYSTFCNDLRGEGI